MSLINGYRPGNIGARYHLKTEKCIYGFLESLGIVVLEK